MNENENENNSYNQLFFDAQEVIKAWSSGDLAGAVRNLEQAVEAVDAHLASLREADVAAQQVASATVAVSPAVTEYEAQQAKEAQRSLDTLYRDTYGRRRALEQGVDQADADEQNTHDAIDRAREQLTVAQENLEKADAVARQRVNDCGERRRELREFTDNGSNQLIERRTSFGSEYHRRLQPELERRVGRTPLQLLLGRNIDYIG